MADWMLEANAALSDALGAEVSERETVESSGELANALVINARTGMVERGGLRCARIFGPCGDMICLCGKLQSKEHLGAVCPKCGVLCGSSHLRWTRVGQIGLPRAVVHPWALPSLGAELGIEAGSLEALLRGAASWDSRSGSVVTLRETRLLHDAASAEHLLWGPSELAVMLNPLHTLSRITVLAPRLRDHIAGPERALCEQICSLNWSDRSRAQDHSEVEAAARAVGLDARYGDVIEASSSLRRALEDQAPRALSVHLAVILQDAVGSLFGLPGARRGKRGSNYVRVLDEWADTLEALSNEQSRTQATQQLLTALQIRL
ncbi:MAG: hypothetical protein Q8Q09_21065 [Deltaproteobacteria bacterium]|nr:hypothetical protein [Deltaproteobacteria bacterium]